MASFDISTKEQLCALTMRTGEFSGGWKNNTFNLTADIDLAGVDPNEDGKGWFPIGNANPGDYFNGQFKGNGHIISNVTIDRPKRNDCGFFGAIDVNADDAEWDHDYITDLALVDVNITGDVYVGGLLGYILGEPYSYGYCIRNCYVSGEVTTTRIGGGFAGGSNNGYFKDCYANVQVTCANSQCEIGSFLGAAHIGTRVENCYGIGLVNNTGPVTEDTNAGGFVGDGAESFSGTDCFWDKTTTGKETDGDNGVAIGKTTTEMKQEATFTNWDFTNDWWIVEGETYPILRVFGGASEEESEPELEVTLVKGNNLLGSLQITNPQIIGEGDFSDDICPQGQDCDNKCDLIDVPNEYHPGTEDSIINF